MLDECADRLKPVMAQVFSLREVAGMETEEICKELDRSPTNCWVLLHRRAAIQILR
ncbi:MAG TPA: sigma factor-like helix-turn-helix DNA-binding protein [Thiobacillus sp.]|nr:sigma factor-like helix-turn-helix DNA-binding protein [Thiobacillus sp.]